MRSPTLAESHRINNLAKAQEIFEKAELASEHPELVVAQIINDKVGKILNTFITEDRAMEEVKSIVRTINYLNEPVIITGPSGTGKDILARALNASKDPTKFFAINCSGLPESLMESELFGHAKGSFSGATSDYSGLFRAAEGGTLFLDEIAEASPNLQAKLLRALQPDEKGRYWIRPVGSTTHIQVNCRVVCATKKNLLEQVKLGNFREDLYGRLMTFHLETTPLSERPLDITVILNSLDCTDHSDISNPYWTEHINLINVRALQAYAKRKKYLV